MEAKEYFEAQNVTKYYNGKLWESKQAPGVVMKNRCDCVPVSGSETSLK